MIMLTSRNYAYRGDVNPNHENEKGFNKNLAHAKKNDTAPDATCSS